MNIPEGIFKAYDIRGLVEGELSEDLAYRLGRAFVSFLREKGENLNGKKIVVGQDMRPTSKLFANLLIKGINDQGSAVVDIGLTSTPLFNFACAHYENHSGGIMVTASHNPAKYNGFKITLGNGLPVGILNGMDRIKELVLKNDFQEAEKNEKVEFKDVYFDYEHKIMNLADLKNLKKFKIVLDAGNGMAKVSLPKLLSKLRIEVEYLYLEPDGNFPNHEANPLKTETLKDLQQKVIENKADFGFALDGDADRIGLVDENGEVVPASFIGALIGLEILRKHPGELMLYDLRSSRIVPEVWKKAGAAVEMCPVGHAKIKPVMLAKEAVFASELSLHLYYGDLYNFESADYSLLLILKILSGQNKKLSELWQPLNKYFNSGEINFEVKNKDKILKNLKEKYSAGDLNELDGLLFTYPDWWFNVRASNTEPVLRLNLEAKNEQLMKEKLVEIKNIIES